VRPGEQWLWLVRNRYTLQPLRELLMARGVVFSQHGVSSILESDRTAIYAWERLRTGKALPVPVLRDMYAKLRSGTQIARGHKLLPKAAEEDQLTLAQLKAAHGLLVEGAWFEVFDSIPLTRRAYYRRILREHNTLRVDPQVQLETIHGAKGTEAAKVALFLEQSRRTWEEGQKAPDEEHRVWYVGATRAKEELHLVEGQSRFAYHFPD
jgi:superfamily I DNA/RNA helicase